MDDEPRYVEAGEEFEETAWRNPADNFEKKILKVCGRKYFKSQAQANRLHNILNKEIQHVRKYPDAYVEYMLYQWAAKKNVRGIVITLDSFISGVRNPDNLTKWKKENTTPEEQDAEDRASYAS